MLIGLLYSFVALSMFLGSEVKAENVNQLKNIIYFTDYSFKYDPKSKNGTLHSQFKNTKIADKLCISKFEYDLYATNMIINNLSTGERVEYMGPVGARWEWPKLVYILPYNQVVKKYDNFGKYYNLKSGKYRIRSYMHAALCKDFIKDTLLMSTEQLTFRLLSFENEKLPRYVMRNPIFLAIDTTIVIP